MWGGVALPPYLKPALGHVRTAPAGSSRLLLNPPQLAMGYWRPLAGPWQATETRSIPSTEHIFLPEVAPEAGGTKRNREDLSAFEIVTELGRSLDYAKRSVSGDRRDPITPGLQ